MLERRGDHPRCRVRIVYMQCSNVLQPQAQALRADPRSWRGWLLALGPARRIAMVTWLIRQLSFEYPLTGDMTNAEEPDHESPRPTGPDSHDLPDWFDDAALATEIFGGHSNRCRAQGANVHHGLLCYLGLLQINKAGTFGLVGVEVGECTAWAACAPVHHECPLPDRAWPRSLATTWLSGCGICLLRRGG